MVENILRVTIFAFHFEFPNCHNYLQTAHLQNYGMKYCFCAHCIKLYGIVFAKTELPSHWVVLYVLGSPAMRMMGDES